MYLSGKKAVLVAAAVHIRSHEVAARIEASTTVGVERAREVDQSDCGSISTAHVSTRVEETVAKQRADRHRIIGVRACDFALLIDPIRDRRAPSRNVERRVNALTQQEGMNRNRKSIGIGQDDVPTDNVTRIINASGNRAKGIRKMNLGEVSPRIAYEPIRDRHRPQTRNIRRDVVLADANSRIHDN